MRGRFWAARLALHAVLGLTLAACGGGGGGGGGSVAVLPPPSPPISPPPPPPPPPPPSGAYPDAASNEYLLNWAVADTRALTGWEDGATGAGVVVGVIDDGVQASHPEIDANVSPLSRDIVSGRNTLFSLSETHGSELTALIAGEFNGASTVGLAFEATVIAIRADNGSGGFTYSALADSVDYAVANGVQVINFSLGAEWTAADPFLDPGFTLFANALQRATGAGVIIINSAGNEGPGAPQVNYPGYLATNPAYANGLIVSVGAHTRTLAMASFSNHANDVMQFYLTAPGTEIIVPDFGNAGPTDPAFQVCGVGLPAGACRVQGTSYSAPIVTGAVALLLEAFPGLTPQQIVQLLLTSTDDAGAAGVDAVWGHGRLNLAKAFAPVGTVAAPLPSGGAVYAGQPIGVVGQAYGDAFTSGAWSAVGFDALGRSFRMDLGQNWRAAARDVGRPAAPLWRRAEAAWGQASFGSALIHDAPASLRRSMSPDEAAPLLLRFEPAEGLSVTYGLNASTARPMTPAGGFGQGHSALAGAEQGMRVEQSFGGARLSLLQEEGGYALGPGYADGQRTLRAARFEQSLGALRFGVSAGDLADDASLVGLAWTEARGAAASGRTRFFSGGAGWVAAPGLDVSFEAEWGSTEAPHDRWLQLVEPVQTSAFALAARRSFAPSWLAEAFAGEGALSLALRQPLRVEAGALLVRLPTATAYGRRSLRFEDRVIDLAPSGRELDIVVGYDFVVPNVLVAHAAFEGRLQPGHRRNAEPEYVAHFGFRWSR